MSSIHHLHGVPQAESGKRARGPYRRKVTAAEFGRAVDTAHKVGLTIYGFTIDGDKIHFRTRPDPEVRDTASAVDAYFASPRTGRGGNHV